MPDASHQELSAIAGLDATKGLEHLRGRSDSYLRLLRVFVEARGADIEALREHLAAQDYDRFASVVHNITGVAGFLGAVGIQAAAAEAYAAVRAGREAAEIQRLAEALIEAQAELAAQLLPVIDGIPNTAK